MHKFPRFLAMKGVNPFISNSLMARILSPIEFRPFHGGRTALGYEATLLPEICEVVLDADNAGLLKDKKQAIIAQNLLKGFARVGIIALIDEATGYQEKRAKDALSQLLSVYLSEERLRWAKIFPDEFYKEIYRLRKWVWPSNSGKTSFVGKITNDIVYERLPDGVLDELRVRNPVIKDKSRRRWTHTQFLSEDIGQPDLRAHLLQLIAIMKASTSWSHFQKLVDRVFPKSNQEQIELFDVHTE